MSPLSTRISQVYCTSTNTFVFMRMCSYSQENQTRNYHNKRLAQAFPHGLIAHSSLKTICTSDLNLAAEGRIHQYRHHPHRMLALGSLKHQDVYPRRPTSDGANGESNTSEQLQEYLPKQPSHHEICQNLPNT
jgi:hypothetical protein